MSWESDFQKHSPLFQKMTRQNFGTIFAIPDGDMTFPVILPEV